MINFLGQEIRVGKTYVYIKNERTGSSTVRKLKMIGKCVKVDNTVVLERLWCECLPAFYVKVKDKIYNPEDIICEYVPTEEQWIKELGDDKQ